MPIIFLQCLEKQNKLMLGNPKPRFTRPEILLHPNIPKPLHGLAVRVLNGDSWWNKTRNESYAINNFCCWACGVHKNNAREHRWLEAHENYKIDYKKGRMEITEITALCHYCHNYIHDGRMIHLLDKGEITEQKYLSVINHGQDVLRRAGFTKFKPDYPKTGAKWNKWHLVLDDKTYKTPYKNITEWAKVYNVNLRPLGILLDIDWQLDIDSLEEWNL